MAAPLQDTPSQSSTHDKELEEEEEEEEEVMRKWDVLEHTLDRVVQELLAHDIHQPPFAQGKLLPRHDYISLYQQIYNFLSQDRGRGDKYGNKLFDKYEQIVRRSIHTIFQTEVTSEENKGARIGLVQRNDVTVGKGEEGLESFLEKVKAFKQKMHVLSHIFSYMERYFIPRKSLPTLEEVANVQLNEQVLRKVAQQLMVELGVLVEKRRDGKPINDSLLLEVAALFLGLKATKITSTNQMKEEEEGKEMGAYEDLEAFLLHKTTLYYVKKAPHWPLDTLEKKVEQALQYERDFIEKFLLTTKSMTKFEEALEQVMQGIVAKRSLQKNEKQMSINFDNNPNAPLLNCSIDLKIQESNRSGLGDTLHTTNV